MIYFQNFANYSGIFWRGSDNGGIWLKEGRIDWTKLEWAGSGLKVWVNGWK